MQCIQQGYSGFVPLKKVIFSAAFLFKVCYFQSMQVRILGIGDFGLSTNGEATHGYAIIRIGMGGNNNTTSFIYQTVGGKNV